MITLIFLGGNLYIFLKLTFSKDTNSPNLYLHQYLPLLTISCPVVALIWGELQKTPGV